IRYRNVTGVQTCALPILLVPMIGLAVTVIIMMFITGGLEAGSWDLYSVLENTLVTHSLIAGGIVGLVLSLFYYFRYTKTNDDFGSEKIWLGVRSEEHTSELQSRFDLVCRLLLERKKERNCNEA